MSVKHDVKKQMDKYLQKYSMLSPTPFPDNKIPVFGVEYFGSEGVGKTHASLTFPSPALCDTQGKGYIVMRKFENKNWFFVQNFEDVIRFFKTAIHNDDIKTIIFDFSKDVYEMAEKFTMDELQRDTLWSKAGGVMYSRVNLKIDYFIQRAREYNKNIVFISPLKDEYIGNNYTGRRVRDGYKKSPYQMDIMIKIQRGIDWKGKWYNVDNIYGKVVKNGFIQPTKSKPFLTDFSYNGIVNNLFEEVDREEYIKTLINKTKEVVDDGW